MGELTGKTALVTGGSRGIGRAIAERLGRDGARVALTYVSNRAEAEKAVQTIEAAGGSALMLQADVSELASIEALFGQLRERLDGLDVLVNNAGRGSGGFPSLLETTPETYDAVFDLNARGLFFVTQHAVRTMRDGGRVITISSMAARIRMAGLSVYTASKAAADAFTRSLAMELAPRRITINSVNCGIVETEMIGHIDGPMKDHLISLVPMGRMGQPEDIAEVVAFLASDASRWITGEEIAASGGQYV